MPSKSTSTSSPSKLLTTPSPGKNKNEGGSGSGASSNTSGRRTSEEIQLALHYFALSRQFAASGYPHQSRENDDLFRSILLLGGGGGGGSNTQHDSAYWTGDEGARAHNQAASPSDTLLPYYHQIHNRTCTRCRTGLFLGINCTFSPASSVVPSSSSSSSPSSPWVAPSKGAARRGIRCDVCQTLLFREEANVHSKRQFRSMICRTRKRRSKNRSSNRDMSQGTTEGREKVQRAVGGREMEEGEEEGEGEEVMMKSDVHRATPLPAADESKADHRKKIRAENQTRQASYVETATATSSLSPIQPLTLEQRAAQMRRAKKKEKRANGEAGGEASVAAARSLANAAVQRDAPPGLDEGSPELVAMLPLTTDQEVHQQQERPVKGKRAPKPAVSDKDRLRQMLAEKRAKKLSLGDQLQPPSSSSLRPSGLQDFLSSL